MNPVARLARDVDNVPAASRPWPAFSAKAERSHSGLSPDSRIRIIRGDTNASSRGTIETLWSPRIRGTMPRKYVS